MVSEVQLACRSGRRGSDGGRSSSRESTRPATGDQAESYRPRTEAQSRPPGGITSIRYSLSRGGLELARALVAVVALRVPPAAVVRDSTQSTQSTQLKEIRAADPELARWSFSSQQANLRRLDKAFGAFLRRLASGDKPGYPVSRPRSATTAWNGPPTATGGASSPRQAVCISKVLAT